MILRGREPYLVYGTPGASGQTETLVQVTNNLLLFGMDLQAAIEAPRFRHAGGVEVLLECGVGDAVCDALARKGHTLSRIPHWDAACGGVEAILLHEGGILMGAADPRRDGVALGL
jgi:gamma-glutamyltranspeptidase/glutathione hydrolase